MCAKNIKNIVRKFKLVSTRRKILISIPCAIIFVLFVTLNQNFTCFDFVLDWEISKICSHYYENENTGNMCPDLCAGNSINSFKCYSGNYDYRSRFLAMRGQQNLVVKYAKPDASYEDITWTDSDKKVHYPTQENYIDIVKRLVLLNYNVTLTPENVNNLIKLKNKNNHILFGSSMKNSWELLQNNDFLLSKLFEDKEIFPQIFGTCGGLYVTEYIQALDINRNSNSELTNWKNRIKMAVLILDYLEELELTKDLSFIMCDVNPVNFGISDNRMKYSDLRYIHTKHFVDRLLSNGKICTYDKDCDYKYCKSKCDFNTNTCTNKLLNNNLQIICSKVFRGSTQKPGILITDKTPPLLIKILDKCVSPKHKNDIDFPNYLGPSKRLRKILYNELTNIYENLATG